MFKNNTTPSPKPSTGFLAKLRRNMHMNPQQVSASLKTPGSSSRDLTSPASSTSSNISSPRSKTQTTPPPRRHAALFSKITFGTADFIEDRYVYNSSSPDYTSPREVIHYNAVESGPYFAIPASQEAYIQRLDELFFEGKARISTPLVDQEILPTCLPELPIQSPLRSAFQEVFDFHLDDLQVPSLPEAEEPAETTTELPSFTNVVSQNSTTNSYDNNNSIADLLSALSASLRNDPTEFSPSLFNWDTETFDNPSPQVCEEEWEEPARVSPTTRPLRTQLSIPVLLVNLSSKTLSKPVLTLARQKRVSPRSRAKSSPVKPLALLNNQKHTFVSPPEVVFNLSAMIDSLPPTCFQLLPENSIGLAL